MTMAKNMALAVITKPISSADEIMKMEVTKCLLSLSSFSIARRR
jgi:hypothetical protein